MERPVQALGPSPDRRIDFWSRAHQALLEPASAPRVAPSAPGPSRADVERRPSGWALLDRALEQAARGWDRGRGWLERLGRGEAVGASREAEPARATGWQRTQDAYDRAAAFEEYARDARFGGGRRTITL